MLRDKRSRIRFLTTVDSKENGRNERNVHFLSQLSNEFLAYENYMPSPSNLWKHEKIDAKDNLLFTIEQKYFL